MSSGRESESVALVPAPVQEGQDPTGVLGREEEAYPPKSEWGDGPWQQELIETASFSSDVTDDRGLPLSCFIMRNKLGGWCGYVKLPPDHPWKSMDDAHVNVHGGVSFCEETDMGGRVEKGMWVGFDCGHFNDYLPAMEAFMRKLIPGHQSLVEQLGLPNGYKTYEFVVRETLVLSEGVLAAMARR